MIPSSPPGSSSSDGDSGLIYGLEAQCRALENMPAKEDQTAFLVGTQGMKSESQQIHLLTVNDDQDFATSAASHSGGAGGGGQQGGLSKEVYAHPKGEIWQIAASYKDADHLVTRWSSIVDNSICRTEATLWSRREEGDDDQTRGQEMMGSIQDLHPLCAITAPKPGSSSESGPAPDISHVSWLPSSSGSSSDQVMALSENRLCLNDVSVVENGAAKVVATGQLDGKGYTTFYTGTWNPHQNCGQFATANEHSVRGWDLRTMEQAWAFESSGSGVVRSLDFNANRQYHLCTAGDDGCARFWDLRQASKPLAVRSDHSHWLWCVRFNQFHDQLVLSSSSDAKVQLACMASISSEPNGHVQDDDEDGGGDAPATSPMEDGLLKTFEDHEESVYSVAWSSADPWTFASLSYDGRLVVNRVPRQVKFKILNLV